MANLNVGSLNFSSLSVAARQVLLDFCYPIGSYFITENKNFNTVESVQNHFGGGVWKKITSRTLYASSNDNVGVDEGSNSITLLPEQLPVHSHTFAGNKVTGNVGGFRTENNQSLRCDGVFTVNDGFNPGDSNFWDSPDNDWALKGFHFEYTPSGTIGNTGSNALIDIKGAVRRVYIYYREL